MKYSLQVQGIKNIKIKTGSYFAYQFLRSQPTRQGLFRGVLSNLDSIVVNLIVNDEVLHLRWVVDQRKRLTNAE
jgi:hypothetical protein